MRLAILVTNTDDSAFAQRHPKDDEKFTDLIKLARPDWSVAAYWVKDGVFPENPGDFDGLVLTGSPASVHDPAPWVARLLELIRDADRQRQPMFGACFGHQAIALALGGAVTRNPDGWVHGLTHNRIETRTPWMAGLPDDLKLYGSHVEQVSALPTGAEGLTSAPGTPVTGFSIGRHIYTTQHHPEMTPGFIAALTEELAGAMGPEVAARARASLADRSDMQAFAESIALFFEQAVSQRRRADP